MTGERETYKGGYADGWPITPAPTKFMPGTTVRILIRAGVIADPGASQFMATVEPGTEGVYDCPHPTLDGWHLVMVDLPGERFVQYVPLRPEQMEVVDR